MQSQLRPAFGAHLFDAELAAAVFGAHLFDAELAAVVFGAHLCDTGPAAAVFGDHLWDAGPAAARQKELVSRCMYRSLNFYMAPVLKPAD